MTISKKKSTESLSAEKKIEAPIPSRRTKTVKLSRGELVHLRDLFGLLLPPAATKTLSQALAEHANRPMVEACLWRKLERACESMGVPLGDDAPDFAVSIGSVPELTVFQIEADTDDGQSENLDAAFSTLEEEDDGKSVKKPKVGSKGRT